VTTHPFGSAIFEQHAAKLAASAIAPEVARERGYVSADTKAQLAREGFGVVQRRPPALVIPLWSVTGERAGVQLRPDDPRYLDGKPAKYETRAGQRMLLDVPPRVRPRLGDPARPLVITEGPLKADAAVTAGLDCVALLGVWSWRGTNDDGGRVALADWELVALNDRTVIVAFDSDAMLKPQVHDALGRLGEFLARRGAAVAYAKLPHGDAGAKVGLDDWLAAGHPGTDLFDLATPDLHRPATEPAAGEPVDTFDDVPDEPGWAVLDDIAAILARHVAWPSREHRDAVALWAAHTYLMDVFDSTPRLAVLSPEKGCGKTRVLELVELLARRARLTVSMSGAYMYRAIDDYRPTLLIDEIDTIFGSRSKNEAHEDLRGLINAGFRRGATVGRMVGEGSGMVPTDFAVFTPVALAGIGDCLPDTVLDRSVIIRMRRRAPGETVEPLRRRRAVAISVGLSRRLAAWASRNSEGLDDFEPHMPDGIVDRPADTWEPLIVVADVAGGDWPERARAACVTLNQARADSDASLGVALLADIRRVIGDADRIATADLLEKLADLDEAPWGDWYGKPIDSRWLAKHLKPYGVRPDSIRIDTKTVKGYLTNWFADAWSRYLPPPTAATSGTTGTAGTVQVNGTDPVPNPDRVPDTGAGTHLQRPGTDAPVPGPVSGTGASNGTRPPALTSAVTSVPFVPDIPGVTANGNDTYDGEHDW
jgi:hypothetical protein